MAVIVCGLILFFGLALLVLRRRNEILQRFLTPEETDLEEEFFRVINPKQEISASEEVDEQEIEAEHVPVEESVHWGIP